MIKRIVITLGIAGMVLLIGPGISQRFALVLSSLPLGWIQFLDRTLREVRVNWNGVGMVVACSLVILMLLHVFLAWLARQIHAQGAGSSAESPAPPAPWPWRRTLS